MEVGYVAVDGNGNVYFTAYDNPVMEILASMEAFPRRPQSLFWAAASVNPRVSSG